MAERPPAKNLVFTGEIARRRGVATREWREGRFLRREAGYRRSDRSSGDSRASVGVPPAQRLLRAGCVMRKRHLAVGVVMLLVSVLFYHSYELVPATEARSRADDAGERVVPGAGIHAAAAVVPLAIPVPSPADAPMLEPLFDAVLMCATGAALFGVAAGVRRGRTLTGR